MLDAPARRLFASPLEASVDVLQRVGAGANFVTLVSFFLGVVAVAAIADGLYLPGLLLLALSGLSDAFYAPLARRAGATQFGAFLHALLGFLVYAAVPLAFALERQQNGLAASFLIFSLSAAAITALAAQTFGNGSVQASNPFFPGSLCGRTDTFVLYAIMLFMPWTFAFLPYLYSALCLIGVGMGIAAMASGRGAAKP